MFKFPIALAIGVTTALSAAHADTYIIQGTPSFAPAIVTNGEVPDLPDLSHSILHDPAFHRLAQMCDTLGLACGPDQLTAEGGIMPEWTPEHRADAEKRLAQMIEDREAYAEALEEHFEALPPHNITPNIAPLPRMLFGWNTPLGRPHLLPRPHALSGDLSHLFPRPPSTTRPRGTLPPGVLHHDLVPNRPDLSGFFDRLNRPGAAMPHGLFPRHSFPWRSF